MSEYKEYWITTDEQGSIKISEDVVASIAAVAASETEGISSLYSSFTNDIVSFLGKKSPSKGVKVIFHDDNKVDIDVCYSATFGSNICDVAKKVQENVKLSVEAMTNLKTGKINIHVAGVTFDLQTNNLQSNNTNNDCEKIYDETITEDNQISEI